MENHTEALKDIVCALIASGDYTFSDKNINYKTALNNGWSVVWHGAVVDHASEMLDRIIQKADQKRKN